MSHNWQYEALARVAYRILAELRCTKCGNIMSHNWQFEALAMQDFFLRGNDTLYTCYTINSVHGAWNCVTSTMTHFYYRYLHVVTINVLKYSSIYVQ